VLKDATQPPPRRPAIADVARKAGVSKAAVSKVIRNAYGVSPAMKERVEAAIESLGYRPRTAARAMRGASFTIGIEVPHLNNDFFAQFIAGASGVLSGSGYQLIIATKIGDANDKSTIEALVDRQVDGIITVSPNAKPDWLENLASEIPVILLARHDRSLHYDTITNNDFAGSNLAMDHLFALGHQRIVHLTIPIPIDTPAARSSIAIRSEVYTSRMREAGLEPRVIEIGPGENSAYQRTCNLLGNVDAPSAIFAGYDTLALGALRAIASMGLDSETVSVIGYDGIEIADHPLISLSTVDQSGIATGAKAVELLMERIHGGRTTPKHHQIEPVLRVRSSTKRVPSVSTASVRSPADLLRSGGPTA
jgi:LacI family transcriptional regulator